MTVLGPLVALQVLSGQLLAQTSAGSSTRLANSATPSTTTNDRLLQLIPILTGDGTPVDRRQAAQQILQLGGDEAVKALAGVLVLKNNSAAKIAICDTLADMNAPPAWLAEPLLDLLKQKKDQQIHDAALAALSRFNGPSISLRLKDLLEDEELQWLRTENVARSRELYALLPKEADRIARLQTWLKAAQPLDRLTALEIIHAAMLATTPTPPAKEVLQQIRQMLRDADERVRRALVVVLMDLQEKEDAARILAMLEHERSPVVLEEIYKALGRMGTLESIDACIKGLKSSNSKVAGGAADALGRLCRRANGAPPPNVGTAVNALIELASNPMEDDLRAQIIDAMSEIADPRFLPILIPHAQSSEKVPLIRQAALAGLGQIGDPAQVDLVIARLSEDQDTGVRQAATEALGKLGSTLAHLKPLTACLAETSGSIQASAWEAYRHVFARLSWEERLAVLVTWSGNDKSTTTRRIDLLSDLETQAASMKNEPSQLLNIRESLGDALHASADYALAAGAYTRAVDGLSAERANLRIPLTAKLMDAYLHVPSYDKVAALVQAAQSAQSPEMLDALSGRLLMHVQDLAKTNGKAAIECIARLKQSSPGLFRANWTKKFETIRKTATQPATTKTSN